MHGDQRLPGLFREEEPGRSDRAAGGELKGQAVLAAGTRL